LSEAGDAALERYARADYLEGKVLLWPSQIRGIQQLASGHSFALCTPTGSGKTTVAELALLQSLFLSTNTTDDQAPLAIYLVPTRALASEVEAKLARVLGRVGERVIVTGLYGGTDWGPTDAWLTATDPAVLVCTFEKGEALMRFLGPAFIDRVRLLVVDEAHTVQFDDNVGSLRTAENRPLRLESLVSRLLAAREGTRAIALSAVATGFENSLAEWISGQPGTPAVASSYRSTRQLIGRLMCYRDGHMEIQYDVLDSASLEFQEAGRADKPYVRDPFPPCPDIDEWRDKGPQKRLRPFALWAAINLAASTTSGERRSVLISVTQQIGGLAEDFLELLDSWRDEEMPTFFEPPEDEEDRVLWTRCLNACEDYFGTRSREYRLLEQGVILHHGKMPGLLARLLVEAIDRRLVHVVMATSTLSEGVNLPFEVVLVPTLRRGQSTISVREFANLVGRAGRPGVSTEGRALVLQEVPFAPSHGYHVEEARVAYLGMVKELVEEETHLASGITSADSPLAALLREIKEQWTAAFGHLDGIDFPSWLEETAPLDIEIVDDDAPDGAAILNLDTLDSILLSAITELLPEERSDDASHVEASLRRLWSRTYAHVAAAHEESLLETFLRRGRALVERIYPDPELRGRLYSTSLPPRSAQQLLDLYARARLHLQTGEQYSIWSAEERFQFIAQLVDLINEVPRFKVAKKAGHSKIEWRQALRWWLDPSGAESAPDFRQVSNWHNYISQNFTYRFNWAIGGLAATAMREAHGGQFRASSLDEWPQTGLPWIAIWLKELVTWGTLDPVAAYLLSRRQEWTRGDAELAAEDYHSTATTSGDESLDPRTIREWAEERRVPRTIAEPRTVPSSIAVDLLREIPASAPAELRVLPLIEDEAVRWIDPAGHPLATSDNSSGLVADDADQFDFILKLAEGRIEVLPYLPPSD